MARAIENATRENAHKTAKDKTVESDIEGGVRPDPQDEARLKIINAPKEVHPIALRQQAEKQAAELRDKALEEQKLKIAERAKAKSRYSDKGR